MLNGLNPKLVLMSNQFDIVKVYRCKAKTLDTIFDDDKLTLIWERQ